MFTVKVDYRESHIELPEGETFLGRDLTCRIRFNDPSVSRHHARLVVGDHTAIIEDLSSTNHTKVNNKQIVGPHPLAHQDVVQLGRIWIRIHISEDNEAYEEDTLSSDFDRQAGGAGPEEPQQLLTPPRGSMAISALQLKEIEAPQFTTLTCPRCHSEVPLDEMRCSKCGFRWPSSRTRAVTERIDLNALLSARRAPPQERRQDVRVPIEVPIIYSSEILTFDAMARDLSCGGMFIATEILDEIGTQCHVTVLPDGAPAITIPSEVCHVVASETGAGGRPPGFGIKFLGLSAEARRWLGAELLKKEEQD